MKNYTRPEIAINKFSVEDIITTSAAVPNAVGAINDATNTGVSYAASMDVADYISKN